MTHVNQPSSDHRRPAAVNSGAALPQHSHRRTAETLTDACLAQSHAQDDIVRPELRNDAMLAGKPTRYRW